MYMFDSGRVYPGHVLVCAWDALKCMADVGSMRRSGLTLELQEQEDEEAPLLAARIVPKKPSFSHGYAHRGLAVCGIKLNRVTSGSGVHNLATLADMC